MIPKIQDLELRLDYSKGMKNEFVVQEDGKTVKYVGEATDLNFDGLDITGRAVLTRFDKVVEVEIRKRRVRRFPPKTEVTDVAVEKEKKVWSVETDFYEYFVNSGELHGGTNCDADYRSALKGAAANEGLAISDQLLDAVFGPIDQELLKRYTEVKSF